MSSAELDPQSTVAAHLAALESWGIRRLPYQHAANVASDERSTPPTSMPQTSMPPTSMPPTTPAPAAVELVSTPHNSGTAAATPALSGADPSTLLTREQKQQQLQQQAQQVSGCQKCRLCESRNKTVFGVGDVDARLMFVGEAPGADEDAQGEPFVGKAGQLLNKMISAMGIAREQVYIANILKCRPPGNRDPLADETAMCTPYLVEQISTVAPDVIVTLGKPACNYLLDTDSSLAKLRGQRHAYHGIPLFVTYHPAALLRNVNFKAAAWQDLQAVMAFLGLEMPARGS